MTTGQTGSADRLMDLVCGSDPADLAVVVQRGDLRTEHLEALAERIVSTWATVDATEGAYIWLAGSRLTQRGSLPPAAIETLARHPDPSIRARIADRPDLPGALARQLAGDDDPKVARYIANNAAVAEEIRILAALNAASGDRPRAGTPSGAPATPRRAHPQPTGNQP
jgi:hypothetical protein